MVSNIVINKFKKATTQKKDIVLNEENILPKSDENISPTIIFNNHQPKQEEIIVSSKVDVLDIPEEYTENDRTIEDNIKINKKAHDKFLEDLDKLFNNTVRILNNINDAKININHTEIDALKSKIIENSIIDSDNKISIKITHDIINDATPLINQLPAEFLKNIKHVDKPIKEPPVQIKSESFLKPNTSINISGDRKVLILRNIFRNIDKLYSNFFEFVEDNVELFKQSTLLDNPTPDKYKYIIYDKSITNQHSVYDIYKSWNNDTYETIKSQKIIEHIAKATASRLSGLIPNYITIIICVRENFHFLIESINSVINQTSKQWRIVIINDGSKMPIHLDEIYGEEYYTIMPYLSRIKIVNNTQWNGVVYCQTQALDYVETEIVGILDCDDKLENNCIELVLEMYQKFHGYKDVFVITDFKITDDKFNFIQNGFTKIPNKSILQDGFGLAFRSFKLKDYYKTTGYNPKFRYGGEDVDLIYKLETVATPIFLNRQLYYYRRFDISANNVTKKQKRHLSTSKYHKYNCLMAKIVNGIERYGNVFKIKIYGRNAKDPHEKMIFQTYIRIKKPLKFRNMDYYVELYLGGNCQLPLGLLKTGNTNDLVVRHFIMNYINTGQSEQQVYIKYSFEYRCLVINDRAVDFSIDNHLNLNVNNLYDDIYISVDDDILDIDLDNIPEAEMVEYRKYILEKYQRMDGTPQIFDKLCNFKIFSNINNII
jgi:hypothetical protein